MLRTTFTLILCLVLAGCGVFLLSHAYINPYHFHGTLRTVETALGALQIGLSLVCLYLTAARNPLWRTWQNSRTTADIRKLKAVTAARAIAKLPTYDTAEAAAQAAIDSHLSEPDRSRAKLSHGYSSHYIGLDQLSLYTGELDPALLLLGGFRTVFPVAVDGAVTTGVAVAKESDGGWRFAELGFAPLAKSLAQARLDVAAKYADAESFMLVAVPAMAHYFLGFRSGGTLYFTCLSDWSTSPVKNDETLPAADALARLQPLAAEKQKRYEEADGDLLGG